MSKESDARMEKARKAFRRKRILTLEEVAEVIDGSIHTARRRLKEWSALNSYNQNGRYYALPDVPGDASFITLRTQRFSTSSVNVAEHCMQQADIRPRSKRSRFWWKKSSIQL